MVANAAYPLMAGGRCGATMFPAQGQGSSPIGARWRKYPAKPRRGPNDAPDGAAEIHSGASGAADHEMGIQPTITALI